MAEPILVPATLPPTPLVLADATFLGELANVEVAVAALNVTDPATAQEAANLLRQLTSVGGALEKTRADLKKPYLDLGKKIDEVARLVNLRIERSKSTLRTRLGDWNDKEQARIAAERRRRDEELAALQRQQEAEAETERARVATLAAATPAGDKLDFDFGQDAAPVPKTETERRIEQLTHAPALVAQRPAGVSIRKVLKFGVNNVFQLPEQFVTRTANEGAIRDTLCVGWTEGMPIPQVPGLVFWVDTMTVSTGRRS